MKRILAFTIATILSVLGIALTSCSTLGDNICELRDSVYKAQTDNLQVWAYSGKRETVYKIDGKPTTSHNYFMVVVQGVFESAPIVKIKVDQNEYEQVGNKHPFNDEYLFEFKQNINADQVNATICIGNQAQEIVLVKEPKEFLSYASALSIAKKEIKSVQNYEIIARIIENPIAHDGQYFWYIAFCKSETDVKSVLIDKDGNVVAKSE